MHASSKRRLVHAAEQWLLDSPVALIRAIQTFFSKGVRDTVELEGGRLSRRGVPASRADHGAAPTRGGSISLTKWDGWADGRIEGCDHGNFDGHAASLSPRGHPASRS
jgi:hypothetical protein